MITFSCGAQIVLPAEEALLDDEKHIRPWKELTP